MSGRAGRTTSARAAVVEMLLAALLFAGMALFTKRVAARLPGPEIACVRFVIGILVVIPLAFRKRLQWNNLRGLALRGIFGGIAVLLYFLTIEHLSAGLATLFNYASPAFAAGFAAIFLGERITPRVAGALLTTLLGLVLVVHGSVVIGLGSSVWYFTGLASALVSGAAIATIRSVRKTDGSLEIFAAFGIGGALLTLPPSIALFVVPTAGEWILLAAIGILAAAAQLSMTHAYRYVPTAVGGVVMQMTPVFTLILGALFFREPSSATSIFGAALVVTGMALVASSSQGSPPRAATP